MPASLAKGWSVEFSEEVIEEGFFVEELKVLIPLNQADRDWRVAGTDVFQILRSAGIVDQSFWEARARPPIMQTAHRFGSILQRLPRSAFRGGMWLPASS